MKEYENAKREIPEIIEDFLDNISEDGKSFVLNEKAKSAVKEIVDNYAWEDKLTTDYKAYIKSYAEKHGIDTVSVCVRDMMLKVVNAPTVLHTIGTVRYVMPVLWEFIKEKDDDKART